MSGQEPGQIVLGGDPIGPELKRVAVFNDRIFSSAASLQYLGEKQPSERISLHKLRTRPTKVSRCPFFYAPHVTAENK